MHGTGDQETSLFVLAVCDLEKATDSLEVCILMCAHKTVRLERAFVEC